MSPRPTAAWFDAQYNNRARIPEHPEIFKRWAADSARARASLSRRLDLRYGSGPGETLDVFPSPRAKAPVLVFIHGGWWRSLDKADHSFIAPPFVDAGAMVVLPNYALAPSVSIDAITLQMTQALAWVYRQAALYGGDPKRIVVAGHSAGGHLAAMLLICRWKQVGADLPAQLVQSAVGLSGLYELDAIRRTPYLQTDLRLTPASVKKLSPAWMPAPGSGTFHALVGALESEEFQRQNILIQQAWGKRRVPVCEALAGGHHLGIVDDFATPGARSHEVTRGLLGARDPGPSC